MSEIPDPAEWGRRLSTAVVMFHEAVGTRLGLSAADQRALALVTGEAPMTAGRLAQLTGLTPGAVTGLVDRLERAGHVRRSPDPADRRRVLVVPVRGRRADPGDAFAELGRDMAGFMAKYDEHELAVIADYVRNTIDVLERQTRRLGEGGSA
ncbi:MarR family winged helix-turn-helix transcriptional regulator [Pseudonocardia alaniniphila]|uniref:MarR family transcriptional regulator n=1 Tax=Pseudonocardia alaniniphila TaxID=75291 RepID=A0ABS9T7W9_9PSEU|nr:helix-turn-helix domain-containing protein [Pseudonocardia alaniniphila]MCH6164612.1 MarR family transcriptional regulator [Pseudonocardia alaniniphila]